MKNWIKHFVVAGAALAVLGAGMVATPVLADPLKDRKSAMRSISKANKVCKKCKKSCFTKKARI